MQVGQVLREARLKRGLDLYEVKRVTKISVPALRAMEEDRWDQVPAPGSEALLEAYALVWVCLVDQSGRPVINGLNLIRDQTVGPYDGKAFDVTFGNGKVDLTVNGQPVNVPPIAAPLAYRITPEGTTRLSPSDGPTCT